MNRRAVSLAALTLGALLAACDVSPGPAPWTQEAGYRWQPLEVRGGRPGFTSLAARSGIQFQNSVSESLLVRNRILGQGAGVALGDVDGDGNVDVFLARTEGCNALFRNLGAWKFEDVTQSAGVGACDRFSTGSAFADVDADGDLDLLLLATTGPNAVFVNDGKGVFTERRDLGLDTTGRGGTTIAMADVDGDARLDLFVSNYKPYHVDDSIPPQQRAFNQVVRQAGSTYEVVPQHRRNYKLVMRPDMGGMRITTRAEPDELYRNTGGKFERIPFSAGRFRDAQGKPETEEPESYGLMARFADVNGDGAPDLYVANDFEDADELWLNEGSGTAAFRRAPWTAQRQISNSSMGIDVGDVTGDGLPDLFAVDMLSQDTRRLKTQIPTHSPLPKKPGDIETQLQQQRNTLFANRGDGTFAEIGFLAGVQASGWSWGTMLLDADLDGWQDILIAAGHLWDIMDADTQERLQNRLTSVPWQRFRWEFPQLPLQNVAFRNRGDMTFEDASAAWRFGGEPGVSHALASADLDGDGDLDVIVNRLGSPALVLRNDASARRVAVRLVGDAPNTRAVGSQIRLLGGAVPIQVREVTVGGLYMSHSDYEASFAMGTADSATLVVDWRDGRRTELVVRPNRRYEISASTAIGSTARQLAGSSSASRQAETLFEDASAALGGHAHVETSFDDWERQFLLPNSLSQLGPGVAWFDLDRDGDEDLLVGTGRGGQLGVFRNDRGRLAAAASRGPAAEADFAGVLGLSDAAGPRILAAQTSWEGSRGGQPLPAAVSLAVSRGVISPRAEPLLPMLAASPGPMALADYDGDGDLDLFVGGRAEPGQYPRPTASFLFRNESGKFVADPGNVAALSGIGLVSAASFSDIDADGDADLIVAREWDSLLLLLNDAGKFTPAPASWGLGRWTSRWNGVATGDLNGDGLLDLVATSWGRNTMLQADSANPLILFHGPIGSGGEEEMLIGRMDPRVRGVAPLNSYPRVRVAIPGVSDRVRTFAEYADASVEKVLGPHMAKVARKPVVTLDHTIFLNRGGRFEAIAMPVEAQQAPAFYAGVADFDGDGAEDVILAQNFSATAVGIPRYDAGRGLLLTGDGTGRVRAVEGSVSGIRVYGDQRGAGYADFDADGRLDLAMSQNGGRTVLLRNRAAKPGLRVRVEGPPNNPHGIGARLRLVFGDRMGPVREIQAGSGYWSQNGATQVLGFSAAPTAVWVAWPGGGESRVPVQSGAREVVVRAPR